MSDVAASGRSIEEIAAFADNLAAGSDDKNAASTVISVAVGQVVGVLAPGDAYAATLSLVRSVMRGHLEGAETARWSIKELEHGEQHRSEHAARLRAVADVIEASTVKVACLDRAVAELRAYAEVYAPAGRTSGLHPLNEVEAITP